MKPKIIRLIRYILIFVCALLVVSLVNNISTSRKMAQTLENAKQSLSDAQADEESLKQDLGIIESDYYFEKEARNKLGLVKENEIVVVLPSDDVLRKLSPRKVNDENYRLPESNWKKWMSLFL